MSNRITSFVATFVLLGLAWARPAAANDGAGDRGAFAAVAEQVGEVRAVRVDPAACAARPATSARRDWRFFVAPYGWLASVEGTIVSGGVETDVEVPFSDLVEFVNGGFQLYAEARWRKLFVAFDGTWAQLGTETEGTLIDVGVDVDQRIFDMRVGYEILRRSRHACLDPRREAWRRWIVADVFVGVRYWYTRTTVDLKGRGPIGIEARLEGTDERWDPFVGARFGIDLTPRWGLGVRGDVGGFGIGDAAAFAWQVSGGLSYDLNRWMHLFVGWRALGFDTVSGSGAARAGAEMVQHGPLVGLGFSF